MGMFKLHYYVSNGGDGSASVRLCKTEEEAEKEDEGQSEGWGESSASSINLKLEGGKLFYSDYEYVGGKYTKLWIPLEEVKNG